jgi:hypothetical protein
MNLRWTLIVSHISGYTSAIHHQQLLIRHANQQHYSVILPNKAQSIEKGRDNVHFHITTSNGHHILQLTNLSFLIFFNCINRKINIIPKITLIEKMRTKFQNFSPKPRIRTFSILLLRFTKTLMNRA